MGLIELSNYGTHRTMELIELWKYGIMELIELWNYGTHKTMEFRELWN